MLKYNNYVSFSKYIDQFQLIFCQLKKIVVLFQKMMTFSLECGGAENGPIYGSHSLPVVSFEMATCSD